MDMNAATGKRGHLRGVLRSWLLAGGLAPATVAACGSSSSSTATSSPGSSAPAGASSAALNGQGQTLYMLTSETVGTVKDAGGNLEVTYNHWPLYTFSGDSGPGVARG
jgi:hypothetical protein